VIFKNSKLRFENQFDKFVKGLTPKIILDKNQSCLKWAEEKYFIGGRIFSLKGREYLREILECDYQSLPMDITVMKSSQSGVSEIAVLFSYFFMDVFQENVFYGFPNNDGIGAFVQSRIQPRIDDSMYLTEQFNKVANVKLKQLRNAFLFLRGTNSPSSIKSADCEFVIWDELDEMKQAHVPILERRLGDSELKKYRWKLKLSTPTYPDYGIHWEFLKTDQRRYHQICEHCGEDQVMDFFKNVIPEPTREQRPPEFEPRYICQHCGKDFNNKKTGTWIPDKPENKPRGYHVSKLFSEKASVLWESYRDCKDELEVEAFHNHDLGEPYAQAGSKLSMSDILGCIDIYNRQTRTNIYMGVDVGKGLNVTIFQKTETANLIEAVVVTDFEELDQFMIKYSIVKCVIDALPETRKAREFQKRFEGRVVLCFYSLSDQSKYFEFNEDTGIVRAQRTNIMERVMNNVKQKKYKFYPEIKDNTAFKEQMMAPQKVHVKDEKTGNMFYQFLEGNKPDHYYHAVVYAEIAMDRAAPVSGRIETEYINEPGQDQYTEAEEDFNEGFDDWGSSDF